MWHEVDGGPRADPNSQMRKSRRAHSGADVGSRNVLLNQSHCRWCPILPESSWALRRAAHTRKPLRLGFIAWHEDVISEYPLLCPLPRMTQSADSRAVTPVASHATPTATARTIGAASIAPPSWRTPTSPRSGRTAEGAGGTRAIAKSYW
jgi:hypothetical protein